MGVAADCGGAKLPLCPDLLADKLSGTPQTRGRAYGAKPNSSLEGPVQVVGPLYSIRTIWLSLLFPQAVPNSIK